MLRSSEDFSRLPGTAIHEFGEHVRDYAANAMPNLDATKHPIYIGGWPSANFWFVNGDLILSSLLYSGQVLVRDPIADWFSNEQYLVQHLFAARPGYLDPQRLQAANGQHSCLPRKCNPCSEGNASAD
jgi:hypothetical protein